MGYPETGQVTEIVPPSTDFTEGMGRTRGGPAREEEKENEMEIIARSGLLSRGGREGERSVEPAAIMKPHFAAEKFSNTAKLGMKG